MKKYLQTRGSLILVLLAFVSVSLSAQNLLKNPSFESDLSDWATGTWGTAEDPEPTVNFTATTDYSQEGTKAAKIEIVTSSPDAGKAFFRQQNLSLSTTAEYTLTFYVLSNSGAEESFNLSLYSHTNMDGEAWGQAFVAADVTFQGDGQWQQLKYTFTPSAVAGTPDFTKLALSFSVAKNVTTLYLDNFSLTSDAPVVDPTEYFVAKDGDDANTGEVDSPFLTISKAASVANAGDVVTISEGTYEETLTPANSGVDGNPIVFQAAAGEKVIITAMQSLSGWTQDAGSVYKTTVDWDLEQDNFVMNGDVACDLARWPNNTDGNPFTLNSKRNTGGSGKDEINAYLTSGEIPNLPWENGGSIFFYGDLPGSGWTTWKSWISASSASRVEFSLDKNPDWIRTFHYPAGKGDFYLEGIKEALDYDNEWYFDNSTNELFIQVPGGNAPEDGAVQMRRRSSVINLENRNYIEIKNIATMGGSIEINGTGNKLTGVSCFYGSMTRGVTRGFSSGKQAVLIKGSNNIVEHCEVAFGAGSGINVGGNDSQILDSRVHDFNMLGCYDAPMYVRDGQRATIKNNEIFNGGRDAIQIITPNSEVAYNDIHHSNLIADDCALLYTLGKEKYMKIHHNWFHDAAGRGGLKKAAGIYLDNDAGDIDVYNNVVWNTEWTNIQINWNGTNLNIYNNTLWNGSAVMGAWHKPGTAFSNVNVWNNLSNSSAWEEQADKQNNLTISSGNPFTDLDKGDFTLAANTTPIDYGREITGFTEGHVGDSPDAGAYEYGATAWTAGITWNPEDGAAGVGCYGLPGDYCSIPVDPSELDSDGDGVSDDIDQCPDTAPGVDVDENGCEETVGIDDLESANMRLYPNPVKDSELTISSMDIGGLDYQYSIYTLSGVLVQNGYINNNQTEEVINVSSLANGYYFIVLQNNNKRVGQKFIKM